VPRPGRFSYWTLQFARHKERVIRLRKFIDAWQFRHSRLIFELWRAWASRSARTKTKRKYKEAKYTLEELQSSYRIKEAAWEKKIDELTTELAMLRELNGTGVDGGAVVSEHHWNPRDTKAATYLAMLDGLLSRSIEDSLTCARIPDAHVLLEPTAAHGRFGLLHLHPGKHGEDHKSTENFIQAVEHLNEATAETVGDAEGLQALVKLPAPDLLLLWLRRQVTLRGPTLMATVKKVAENFGSDLKDLSILSGILEAHHVPPPPRSSPHRAL
jgi:hypothetical protein